MGILTIAFDDAYKATFTNCAAFLAENGIPATFAVPSSCIGKTLETRPVIDKDDVLFLKDNGHEIASHTSSHKNLLDLFNAEGLEAVKKEMKVSKETIEKEFGIEVESFVFPFIENNYNQDLCSVASKYYASSRITTERIFMNWLPLKSPYTITGMALTDKLTINYCNKLIDLTRNDDNLWLIEVFHLVSDKNTISAHRNEPYRFFTPIDAFRSHIEYVISSGIEVLTQKEAVRRFTVK